MHNKTSISSFGLLLIISIATSVGASAQEEPRALLDGVRASRLAIMEGHVTIDVDDEIVFDNFSEKYTINATWKDDSVRFIEIDAQTGQVQRVSLRHQGELLTWRKEIGGTIDDSNHGYERFLFDPRILGGHPVLTPTLTASTCIFPVQFWSYEEFPGLHEVEGTSCVKVRMSQPGIFQDYWIEPRGNLNVRKIYDANNSTTTICWYDYDSPLPSKVEVTKKSQSGVTLRNTTLNISEIDTRPVDVDIFSMAGLNMLAGTSVTDQRIHQVVGYWNGKGLSPTQAESLKLASTLQPSGQGWRVAGVLLIALGGFLAWHIIRLVFARNRKVSR